MMVTRELIAKEGAMDKNPLFFADAEGSDIFALGRYVQAHVDTHWETVFHAVRETMVARYEELGDGVYGLYGTALFRPIHAQFREAGWRVQPRLPGNFGISREWGGDERDRQRWMWSKVTAPDGMAWGTIATGFYHDHCEIRIPRPFRIIALRETTKGEVVKALATQLPEFGNALEANIEYAEYLNS
jgi:hypothetical protein